MRCKHPDIDTKYTKFWEFLNPELLTEIPAGDVLDLIEEIAIIALPVLQEAFNTEDTKNNDLYTGVLIYFRAIELRMLETVKMLCKQILRKG